MEDNDRKKRVGISDRDEEEQGDAVLQTVEEKLPFCRSSPVSLCLTFQFHLVLCPYLTYYPLSLALPFSSSSSFSENSEICPDDKQRNKAKSDEVQRTFTLYSLLHTAILLN